MFYELNNQPPRTGRRIFEIQQQLNGITANIQKGKQVLTIPQTVPLHNEYAFS